MSGYSVNIHCSSYSLCGPLSPCKSDTIQPPKTSRNCCLVVAAIVSLSIFRTEFSACIPKSTIGEPKKKHFNGDLVLSLVLGHVPSHQQQLSV
mmetsp:Transcript_29009/g.70026  ORF Transcript_29009/g.70026 Transcript_29009/m.70026 type:complete len:93 (-) Transcript_29009:352-630(-)